MGAYVNMDGSKRNILYLWKISRDEWIMFEAIFNATADFKIGWWLEFDSSSYPYGDGAFDDIVITQEECPAAVTSLSCNFDSGSCGFITDVDTSSVNHMWNLFKGSTPSGYTGPSSDHTSGSGYYYYAETSNKQSGDIDRLLTPVISSGQGSCSFVLNFWYHAYGSNLGRLDVKYLLVGDSTLQGPLWSHVNSPSSNSWKEMTVQFSSNQPFQFVFEVTCGSSYTGDYGIDDVTVSEDCPLNLPWSCSFDADKCGMIDQTDDDVDWIRKTGSTLSSSTGASADHTSGSGHYMYIEASDDFMSDSDKARLATPYLNNPSGCTGRVSFWYHAYGDGLGHLKVFYMKVGDSTLYGPVWTHPGVTESHNQWKTGSVEIPTTSAYKVVFEASRGTSSKSDYCLDDISITAGRCGGWWFNCDFEQDECGLVQSTEDDGDWTRHAGSTSTSGTGPSGDHTTGSGYYMYMEANSMEDDEYVILETPLFPVLNTQCTTVTVNLWYHALGNKWKSFKVSYVDSIGSYTLFHIKEWEKDFWRFVTSSFKPSVNFKVQFYAERKDGEAADIAIDDISISQADCAVNTAHELSQASPYQCTFDDGTCQFVQDGHSDDNFDWYLNTQDTDKSNTGPSQDHTSGIGYYYYVNTELNDEDGHTARLLSPNFHSSCGGATLGFWYNADGNDLAGLNVKLKKVGSSENLLWRHDGTDEDDVWREVTLEIDSDTNFVIVFETESQGDEGEYAIDDVTLTVPSDCGELTYNFTCNFDTNDCGVTQRTDDNGDWQRNSGTTSTSGTGPSSDHSGSGSYFYIDGTDFGEEEYAVFETPPIDLAYNCSLVTLRYWYHGYGNDLHSLSSKLVDDGGEHWIHFIKIISYNKWFLVESSFKLFSKFRVRFTATTDDGEQSDLAVDDISVSQTDCNENALTQFSCTFEDGVCGFEQDWDDDTNFFLSTRQTVSSGTGPSGDYTDMSDTTGYFFYLEGSDPSPQPNGAIARVRTPWIDLGSTGACAAALNFWYHAFGAALGDLRVYYHLDDGSNDKLLWSQGGSSEDKWKSKLLLLPLKNIKFQIVFEAQRGNNHKSDYAIDDVNILTQMNCENLAFGKEAYAGSTNAVSPYQALDGNLDPIYSHKSCWESNAMTDPWFVVDLQRYTFITTVTITGRGDCCNDHLHDFVISVTDEFDIDRGHNSSTWIWCSNYTGTWPAGGATDTFNCASPLAGRYVSIQIEGNNEIMNLCEIQVKGDDNSGLPYETSCDFENSTICNFNQLTSDQFDWTLKSGSTPTASTGPSADPITKEGIGHYLYIEVDGQSNGAMAALETPDLEVHQCGLVTLRFWAHIYGGDVNALTVILLEKESGQSTFNRNMKLFHLNEVQNAWKEYTWILQPSGITHFKIQFNGIAGAGTGGDIAIDGIRVIQVPGNCKEVVSTPASFQFDGDNCGFSQDKDEELEWTLYKREAPGRSSTGPQADHTGNDGFYYLLEPRYQTASSQAIARIRSPWINISQEHCQATVSFEYHAFGSHLVTFNVKYQINGSSQVYTAWTHDSSSQDQWRHVDVLINTTERFQVIFEGIKASGATVDDSSIAIDDITITKAACGCTPPPNGTMASYSPVKTHYRNSEEVQYTCDAGYSQSAGNVSFTCGVTGQWAGGAPLECDRCNDPGEGVNATKTVGGYQIGGDVTYGCLPGYDVVNGSLRLTCQANFTWDGHPPTCAYLADKTQCASPWGYGYWGNCFIINSTEVSPSEARRKCLEFGGYIAVPADTDIKSHLQNVLSTLPQYSSISKWLVGLHDPYSLNVYRSVDGSFTDVTGIMDTNEPSDVWNQFMVMSQGSGYLLQDFNDSASSFICQKNYGYLGCYQKPTISEAEVTSDKHMSALQCIEYCRGLDYPIVALSLTHCYCRTSYNDLAKADEMMCEETCTGNSLENCGGASHALLFITPLYHFKALSCESLKSQGVVLPGKYWIRPDGKEVSLRVECFMEPCSESLLSSSQVEVSSEAAEANFQKQSIHLYDEGAWAPNTSDSAPWVKLTFNTRRIVTGIVTQGGYTTQSTSTNWITQYRVTYNDGKGWHNYSSNGTLELSGNTDWNGLVTQYMHPPFIADAISIHLLAWNGRPELRLEVLGCSIQSVDDNDNYVGCYIESSGALSEMPVSAGTVTTADECINNCRNLDMIYAGISVGNCSCSNSLGRIGQLKKSSHCKQKCTGNTNQYCGDEGMLSVYRVWDFQCPPIPQVSRARSNSTSRTHGSVVGYQCDTGYMFPSDAENITAIQCEQVQWTQTPPDCQVVNCTTSPPSVANSTSVQGGIRYGSNVNYTCYNGYQLPNGAVFTQSTCQADGTWSNILVHCEPKHCGSRPSVTNALVVLDEGTVVTSRISYHCNPGYQIEGSDGLVQEVTCSLEAQWNTTELENCTEAPTFVGCVLSNGGLHGTGATQSLAGIQQAKNNYALRCITECKQNGYALAGLSEGSSCQCGQTYSTSKIVDTATCNIPCSGGDTTQWCGGTGKTAVYRTDTFCPMLPVGSTATVNTTHRLAGTVVAFICKSGNFLSGGTISSQTYKCLPSGHWTPTVQSCIGMYVQGMVCLFSSIFC
ncbi:MAM and LDL-receptor class A domain-containing protein 1 [Lingula anatina]|uniref:MAM and LDL-receptor class A domain-containing protein 1 n=1 Tax=Lingula anatina TaxID=7574 RepID=A0A1S3ICM3_LINAN|nr:MAM and LDL-receptor class A domain-containing protein 1 [Lingula anatina]|eukprot:XP_013395918.1 MAM and LDL-receptor class A domain-containing protein 1 [Lingula anatina]